MVVLNVTVIIFQYEQSTILKRLKCAKCCHTQRTVFTGNNTDTAHVSMCVTICAIKDN